MGCCSLSARQAGSAGTGQDEVELLKTGRSRKWSISEGQSEGSLYPKDPVALSETEDDSEERLLILFPEDLLFLSVVKERTAITYELSNRGDRENGQRNKELRGAGSSEQLWETKKSLNIKDKKEKSEENIKALFFFSFLKGKLPLTGIQAKEKSAMLRRLRFEVTGSLTEPILITCSTAEDYEKMPLPPTDGIGQRTLLQQYLFSSLGLSQPHIDSSKLYVPPKLSSPFPQKTWVGSSLQAHLSPDRTQHRVPQNIGE
ncbi:uncharacterized protein LOC135330731 isoform X2 [Dromaius novaehollandiae]|uniref:uncharacterized protein LOC135330731 isoform X2 n=1 Tax=Dromaius novaehollandiae TaxID=8790 RepID=UPI00311F01EA